MLDGAARHTELFEKVAGLNGIASALNQGETKTETRTEANEKTGEQTASFKKKNTAQKSESEEETEEAELDEEEQAKLELFETAEKNMNDREYAEYFQIVQFLAHHPKLSHVVYDLLIDESKRMKQAA